MRRNVLLLLVLVAVVIAGWSYAWMRVHDAVVAGIDDTVADLSRQGIVVSCPERVTGGWPFRVTVACTGPEIRLPDGSAVSADRLEANGVVVDPNLTVVRIGAPLVVRAADGSHADATFADLRASVRMTDGRLGRISLEAADLAVNGVILERSVGRLTARHGEMHVRPETAGPGAMELAAVLTDANLSTGAADLLPAEADLGAAVVVRQAMLLDGTPEGVAAWRAAGGEVGVTEMAIDVGETRLEASGTATAEADGRLAGTFVVVGTGLQWLTQQVSAGRPLAAPLGALGTAFMIFGKPVDGEEGARAVTMDIRDGTITANGFALGSAPRLY